MNRNIFTNAAPAPDENGKFKARKVAGVPKMNFHVFVVQAGDMAFAGDPTNWVYLGGFKEADGLNSTIEQQDYSDTTTRNVVIKNPGKINFDNITLRKGYNEDHLCRQWHLQKGSPVGQSERYMLDVIILKMTHDDHAVARAFAIRNCWVANYSAESMDDTTTDPWMESLTLAHDGYMMVNIFAADQTATDIVAANTSLPIGANTPGNREVTVRPSIAYRFDYYLNTTTDTYAPVTPGLFLRGLDADLLAE